MQLCGSGGPIQINAKNSLNEGNHLVVTSKKIPKVQFISVLVGCFFHFYFSILLGGNMGWLVTIWHFQYCFLTFHTLAWWTSLSMAMFAIKGLFSRRCNLNQTWLAGKLPNEMDIKMRKPSNQIDLFYHGFKKNPPSPLYHIIFHEIWPLWLIASGSHPTPDTIVKLWSCRVPWEDGDTYRNSSFMEKLPSGKLT